MSLGWAWDSTFPTSFQVKLVLLVYQSHFWVASAMETKFCPSRKFTCRGNETAILGISKHWRMEWHLLGFSRDQDWLHIVSSQIGSRREKFMLSMQKGLSPGLGPSFLLFCRPIQVFRSRECMLKSWAWGTVHWSLFARDRKQTWCRLNKKRIPYPTLPTSGWTGRADLKTTVTNDSKLFSLPSLTSASVMCWFHFHTLQRLDSALDYHSLSLEKGEIFFGILYPIKNIEGRTLLGPFGAVCPSLGPIAMDEKGGCAL